MKPKYDAPVVVSMEELDRSIGRGGLPNSNRRPGSSNIFVSSSNSRFS